MGENLQEERSAFHKANTPDTTGRSWWLLSQDGSADWPMCSFSIEHKGNLFFGRFTINKLTTIQLFLCALLLARVKNTHLLLASFYWVFYPEISPILFYFFAYSYSSLGHKILVKSLSKVSFYYSENKNPFFNKNIVEYCRFIYMYMYTSI